jgi:hypothetical protein
VETGFDWRLPVEVVPSLRDSEHRQGEGTQHSGFAYVLG